MPGGIKDGSLFPVPQGSRPVPTRQPHRYYDILRTNDFFIKPASEYYFEVVKMSPVFTNPGPTINPIRRPDDEEYPANIDRLRTRFPELADQRISVEHLHFLLLHKLHYERLRSLFGSSIPDAAFVLTEKSTKGPWPTIVQRSIDGRTLFELSDQPAPAKERPLIAEQLQKFDGSLHIDWAFENFIWSSSTLFYVDSKPTLFRTERRNEENKRTLMKRFIRPYTKSRWKFWRR